MGGFAPPARLEVIFGSDVYRAEQDLMIRPSTFRLWLVLRRPLLSRVIGRWKRALRRFWLTSEDVVALYSNTTINDIKVPGRRRAFPRVEILEDHYA